MIEQAVAAQPDKRLHHRQPRPGRCSRLAAMTRRWPRWSAPSLLEPVDPIVNDHLGDVYWAVGRKLEAEFQWHRALSFEPEEDEAVRIRRKLEVGLDAVLGEEGATPLDERRAALDTPASVVTEDGAAPMATEVFAPAKINLTLHVTGRRADGYHLLDSLVAFADVGDTIARRGCSARSRCASSGRRRRASVPDRTTSCCGRPPFSVRHGARH